MAKHFITGGAGFIGSHLVDKLIADGNKVTVYDSLVTGKKQWIQHHFIDPNFQFIQADIKDLEALKKALPGHEVVWHLGANTDIVKGNNITDFDLQNCTIGTQTTLEAMRQTGVNKFLFASSATVYGDTPAVSLSESFGPLLPISLYGAGKLACEGLISGYSHLFGIEARMFRFANVVGGRMSHGVIFDFIQKLKKDPKKLQILGNGKQEKPFFLVEDCINGMQTAFQKSEGGCQVYNLGCDTYSTVTGVAKIVIEEMHLKDVKLEYTGGDRGWPGDAPIVHFDVSKVGKLGWKASHTSDGAVREAAKRILGQLK